MTQSDIWFSQNTFIELFKNGMIVDGRAGGFIVGRPNDGIFVIQETDDNRYFIAARFQGGEYLVNHMATSLHFEKINEINSMQIGNEKIELIKISSRTRIINASASPHDKFILIDKYSQFIVNGKSTMLHFYEIEEINESCNPYLECDHSILMPKESIE